jgi:hypothetical protein
MIHEDVIPIRGNHGSKGERKEKTIKMAMRIELGSTEQYELLSI